MSELNALRTLVIMPTYNERDSLGIYARELLNTLAEVDLLVVDDNSPDGTGALADELAASNSRVQVLHRSAKEGIGPAYLAGFEFGLNQGYGYLVEMDADGSHRAIDLPALLQQASRHDLVIGSRWVAGGAVENWPFYRIAISRIGNWYAALMLRCHIRDITAGFRVYRAQFLRELDLESVASEGYSFQVEMAMRCFRAGGRIIEVPIRFVERAHGNSKMSLKIVIEALWRVTLWGLRLK